ncbi:hypothetical protein SAMD00019534_124800 [Acytostelium subglobosum LB1]|uniref:hypothetical protein n=1 Tax=Acytostelium subglobosum LB1 TaxID=1410327 RepID=UPI000644BCB2|nr:hypothetical protein SAMD00019534_124800 [Acytostelium subglobosum LB1]GAM29304.1 hypothetical protein SAMD00019534_124800 [Acytostelium subglobosum LB1]|eukprot:XP_012747731.1 hypothetical protein SAMD00019534_124800 [Acytostelium subglobosum LB1]
MSKFFNKLRSSDKDANHQQQQQPQQQQQQQQHNDADGETLPESKMTIIGHLIKQIKPGSEIKHLVLPCFLLQPRSLLDSLTDFFRCLDDLFEVQNIDNEEERFVQMTKFVLSGWHTRPKGIKKPFNPIVGEVFDCYWPSLENSENEDDKTHFVAEQISHHPPHSAFCLYNKKREVIVNGNISTNYVKFYGNFAESSLEGKMVFHFLKRKETYELTLPVIGVRGILIGRLGTFTSGKTTLRKLNSDYIAHMEFLSKSVIGSSKHHNGIKATINHGAKTLHKIKGNWDSQLILVPNSGHERKLFDVSTAKVYPPKQLPLDQQPLNSSEHIWKVVEEGILSNNDEMTAKEKNVIEERQRKDENHRRDNNIPWIPERFVLREKNSTFPHTYIYKDLESIFPQIASKPVS